MKRMLIVLAFGFVAWFSGGGKAHAACTLLLFVGQCTCTVTANDMAFGNYDPTSNSDDQTTADISVTCTPFLLGVAVSYDIKLSTGHGTYAQRRMNGDTGDHLNYNIRRDSYFGPIWGTGAGGSGTSKVTISYLLNLLTPHTETRTAYGVIPKGQNVKAGAYSDVIVVTVEY